MLKKNAMQQKMQARKADLVMANAELQTLEQDVAAAQQERAAASARVQELEDKIARAQVIDVSKMSGTQVKFGATVTVVDEEGYVNFGAVD